MAILFFKTPFFSFIILSAEDQKDVNAVQCFIENQEGANTIDFVYQ